MTVATIDKQTSFPISPNFSANDRVVSHSKYQKQFVSTIYLPKEATITLSNQSITIRVVYDIPDSMMEESREKSIIIKTGEKTKRIFEIEAVFGGNDFKVMLNRFNGIVTYIEDLHRKENSLDVRKNY